MANGKEYSMLFQLNAQLGSSYTSTFTKAQQQLISMQKEIETLSKTQSDISAYQKQQSAVEATGKKLDTLKQQYDNIQKEIQETEGFSSALENQLLSKQQQIDKTSTSLEQQTQKLDRMGTALNDAGVDTGNLTKESAQLGEKIDEVKQKQEEAAEEANNFGSVASSAFTAVGQAIVAAGIAKALKEIVDYYAQCVEASMEFESAMTGVAKTTDMTDQELAEMGAEIKALSTEIPITTTELANVAEVAGQLGIAKDDLLDFSTVMSMLGTATTMTADEAATLLAQMASITQMDPSYYSNLASAIVDLGNNYSTTEQKITDMAQGIAASANLAGMSEADMVALAAAVTSLGFEAGMGSTSMSKLITEIQTAVDSGEDLELWAGVANMSAAEFAAAWGEDAVSGLEAFIVGLGNVEASGGSLTLTMQELGITEARMSNVIKALATSGDRLSSTLATANSAWEENTALVTEAEKRYGTTQSQLTMMQNAYNNVQVAIGDALTPALQSLYAVATKVLSAVAGFIEKNPALVKAITVFMGVIGAVVIALTAYAAIAKIAAAASAMLTEAIPGVNVIMGVVVAVGALAGILAAVASASSDVNKEYESLTLSSKRQYDALQELNAEYEQFVELGQENTVAAWELQQEISDLTEQYEDTKRTVEELHQEIETLNTEIAESATAYQEASREISNEYESSLTLIDKLAELSEKTTLTTDEQRTMAAIVETLNDRYSTLGLTIDDTTGKLNLSADAIKEMAKAEAAQKQWQDDYDAYVKVLQDIAAQKAIVEETAKSATIAEEEYQAALAAYEEADAARTGSGWLSQIIDLHRNEGAALNEAEEAYDEYIPLLEDAEAGLSELEAQQLALEKALGIAADETEEATDATEEYGDSLQRLIDLAPEYASAIYEAYDTAKTAVYDSLIGQASAFEEFERKSEASAQSAIKNIQSYADAYRDYHTNMQAALDAGLDPEVINTFFSEVTADNIAVLGELGSEGGAELVAEMNGALEGLELESDALSGSMAAISEGFLTEVETMMEAAGVTGQEGAAEMATMIAAAIIENEGIITDADIEAITTGLSEAQEGTAGQSEAVGEALVTGMAAGVFSGASVLYSAMRTVVAKAIEEGKAEADSHSPSKKTEQLIGITLPQGIAVGALKEAEVAQEALREVVSSGIDAAAQEAAEAEGIQMVTLAPQLMASSNSLDADNGALFAENGGSGGEAFSAEETQIVILAPQLMEQLTAMRGYDAISADIGGTEVEEMQPEVAAAMSDAAAAGTEAVSAEASYVVSLAPQLMEQLTAMQGVDAVSAEYGGSAYGLQPVHVAVNFNFEGGVSPETAAELRSYGDEFAERVREVIEDMQDDDDRRSYN